MPIADYEAIAKRTTPVHPRPYKGDALVKGDKADALWQYIEWLEITCGRYIWMLDEREKDVQQYRRSSERNHARWVAAYTRNRNMTAFLKGVVQEMEKPLDQEQIEGASERG